MDEINQNEGEFSNNAICSPPPSFPNKQSTLKNQNMIKVPRIDDLENIDMCDVEGEVREDEEKEENSSVRNIFGSIVDFITSKNDNEEPNLDRIRDLRSKMSPDAKSSLGKLEIERVEKKNTSVFKSEVPTRNSTAGTRMPAKVKENILKAKQEETKIAKSNKNLDLMNSARQRLIDSLKKEKLYVKPLYSANLLGRRTHIKYLISLSLCVQKFLFKNPKRIPFLLSKFSKSLIFI